MDISDAVKECERRFENICFILDGDAFYGDVIHKKSKETECVCIRDRMIFGKVVPNITSYRFILNRIKANRIENINCVNVIEDILSIEKLTKFNAKTYILFQWEAMLDDIWRLFVQGFLRKKKGVEQIIVLKYCPDSNTVKTDFESISIKGSYNAFVDIVCKHKKISAENCGITPETIDLLIDINSKKSKISDYIMSNFIDENDLKNSCKKIRSSPEFCKSGLSEEVLFRLIYNAFMRDKNEKVAKKLLREWYR